MKRHILKSKDLSPIILGEYDFKNHYFINIDTPPMLSTQTTIHEAFHMIFTLQSSYGNFIHMNQRMATIDGRFQYISEILLRHCRKVQESACVFSEIIYLINTKSFETAEHHIHFLRMNNKEYFNYFKPLCPFLHYIEENKKSPVDCKFSSGEMLNLIISIVRISLNVDLTVINPDVFRTKKELEHHIAGRYCPNRIFHDMLKQILKTLGQNTDPMKIREEVLTFVAEQELVCNEANLCLIQDRHRIYFKKLYHDSADFHVLENILSEFTIKSLDAIDILGSGIPTTGNTQYPMVSGDDNEIINRSEVDIGVLFILGDVKSAISALSKRQFIYPQYRNIQDSRFCITFLDYTQTKQYGALLNLNQTNRLCKVISAPIVVNYKVYQSLRQKLLQSPPSTVFVYCDRSYKNAVDIIRGYTDTEKCFQLLDYNEGKMGFHSLIIELEPKFYFLLPIMKLAEFCLFRDIQNGALSLKQELVIDDDLRTAIDTVINCIFYY